MRKSSQQASEPTYISSIGVWRGKEPKTGPQCCYCQQPHPSVSCTTVTNCADRRQVLKTSGRCFNCLRRSHISRTCKSTSRCQKCKRKHHTSICDASSDPPALPSRPVLNPVAPPFQTNNTLCSASVQTMLLQAVSAMIHQPSNPDIILDGGSQKSYLSERAQRLLKLEPSLEQPLSIATFGSGKGRVKVCPVAGAAPAIFDCSVQKVGVVGVWPFYATLFYVLLHKSINYCTHTNLSSNFTRNLRSTSTFTYERSPLHRRLSSYDHMVNTFTYDRCTRKLRRGKRVSSTTPTN